MSERYRITIHSGNDSYTFKTKTRVGEFWNFAEEMKEHTDWENMAIAFKQRNDEALKAESNMEKPCASYLKEGYTLSCDWDYNDDTGKGCRWIWCCDLCNDMFCQDCYRGREWGLKEYEEEQ